MEEGLTVIPRLNTVISYNSSVPTLVNRGLIYVGAGNDQNR